jgi:pimeloyl-ACP methyl ester carboxylesterase
MGGTCELFAFVVWLLRDEFRCVVFDYPSRASRRGRSRVSTRDLRDALFTAADLHGDGRISLFGASFGSLVALEALLAAPERIESAVLQGGFARRRLSSLERLLIRLFAAAPGRMSRLPLARVVQRQNHRPWFPPFDPSRWDFLLENTGSVPIADVAERAAMIRDTDLRGRLAEITRPVLLIHSEGDGIVAEECHRELECGLPHARSERLVQCGHIPMVTHPHRLAKLVREFVSSP